MSSKNLRNLIITVVLSTIVVLGFFSVAYYFLSQNYIDRKNSESLFISSLTVSSNIQNKMKDDYQKVYDYIISEIGEAEDGETSYNSVSDAILLQASSILGYTLNKAYFSGDTIHIGNETFALNDAIYEYYTKPIAIYSFKSIIDEYVDSLNYLVFRIHDLVLYTEIKNYINPLFDQYSDLLDESYYLIFEKTGRINYIKDGYDKGRTLYFDYINRYNLSYDYNKLSTAFTESLEGYEVLNFSGVKSYFLYIPILKDMDQNMYIGFVFEYDKVNADNKYLINTLIIISVSATFVVGLLTFIFGYSMYKKNQDLSSNRFSYYFVKPMTITIDRRGKILRHNRSCEKNIKEFSLFENVEEFKVVEDDSKIMSIIQRQDAFILEFDSQKEEEKIYVNFIPMRVFNKYILIGYDITREHKEKVINAKIASFNQVTNLPNKIIFDKDVGNYIVTPQFALSNTSFVAIDLLDFNKINRLYGYESGNVLLRTMAQRICDSLSETFKNYNVYNVRTSFFLVFIKDISNYNASINWAKKIIDLLYDPIEIKEKYFIQVEAKAGLLNVDEELKTSASTEVIFENMNKSLERAKQSRLIKVALYNAELSSSFTRDQILEQDLKKAIEKDEFEMHFQPQFNIKTKKIVGFEALLRWTNPKYKFDSPEHYVTIAERNGMIIELGRLINEKVFSFAKKIENTGISISLNVSPVQLLQSGFVFEIIKTYDEHKIKSNSIALEITETFLMENRDNMVSKLRILKEKGFVIHLDDFGVGYSSMLYLKDLPVDAIKIDKEFTKYMVSDKITRVIVTRIVQMGSSLDLELIAEGVETERQSELLSRMGCEVIQGYLISQPVSEAEAIKLIEKYNGLNVKVETKVKDYKNDYKEILEETEEEDESSIDESIDDDSSNEDDIGGIE